MRRCLLITPDFPPQQGGVAYYLNALAIYFKGQISVIASPQEKLEEHDKSVSYPIQRIYLYYHFFWPHWLRSVFLLIQKRFDYDTVIISHLIPFGTVARIAQIITKKPYILILHGFDFSLATINGWKS